MYVFQYKEKKDCKTQKRLVFIRSFLFPTLTIMFRFFGIYGALSLIHCLDFPNKLDTLTVMMRSTFIFAQWENYYIKVYLKIHSDYRT
jgi:hypothetical protein